MTKENKIYEVYGARYDWDENGWLLYGCDEATEYGVEPFGEYETRNNIDGYYEWRPIELNGIENNNGWHSTVEGDFPEDNVIVFWYNNNNGEFEMASLLHCDFNFRDYTHWHILPPKPPIY